MDNPSRGKEKRKIPQGEEILGTPLASAANPNDEAKRQQD
jgi:hypothetical protein